MTDSEKKARKDRRTPDLLDAFVAYQENTEPPDIYKKWVGISMIASAMRRKCYLNWGIYKFFPNMFIILVGPPGKARKGTAMNPAKKHLANLQIKTAAEATTKEALIRRIAESSDTYNEAKKGMIGMQTHCSLTVFAEELTVFLGYSNRELMAHLADWFDCSSKWTYDTKGAGTDEITNLWVNILGATTPELMQATMPMELMGGGLSSRMIFVYAPKKGKRTAFPGLSEENAQIQKDVEYDLETVNQMSGQFTVDEDFIGVWTEWYMGKPENCPLPCRHLDYYWERREVHLLKLCLILSASRSNEQVIRPCDFHRANELLTEAEQFMPSAFMGMGHRDDAQVIALILNYVAEVGECMLSDITRQFAFDMDKEGMVGVLEMYATSKTIKIKKGIGKNADFKVTWTGGDRHG